LTLAAMKVIGRVCSQRQAIQTPFSVTKAQVHGVGRWDCVIADFGSIRLEEVFEGG